MRLFLAASVLVGFIALVCEAKFTARTDEMRDFGYMSRKNGKGNGAPKEGKFPTQKGQIETYQSMFPENPTAEQIYANVDMENKNAKALIDFQYKEWDPAHVRMVSEGKIYQAIGFAVGKPVVYITPDNTLIVIDVPEGAKAGQETIDAFRKIQAIGNKPWEAIIYTLFHGDHTWGAGPFVNDPCNNGIKPIIIADKNLDFETNRFASFKGFKFPRIRRMYGMFVPDPPHINDGGVERIRLEGPFNMLYTPTDILNFPTEDSVITKTIGGLQLEFISVPGYTSDQIIVWAPQWQAIHGADTFYHAFPNLYTIRGEMARDVLKWAEGTLKTASYDAEILVTSHGFPLVGKEEIKDMLVTYADAIRYIHDQVIRHMNKGYPPDVIPRLVNLPQDLAEKSYLQERYGMEDVSIKGIYDFYVGWFSGLSEDLFAVDRLERGNRLVDMVGSLKMKSEAAKAYNEGLYEWALELISYVWRQNMTDVFALDLRTECLKRMAENRFSIAARNYMFAQVMEDWDLYDNVVQTSTLFITLNLDDAMQNLEFHVDNIKVVGVRASMCVNLTDVKVVYNIIIRHSIMTYEQVDISSCTGPILTIKDQCDLTNPSDVLCWRFMLAGFVPFTAGVITNGTPEDVVQFFEYFDFQDEIDPN